MNRSTQSIQSIEDLPVYTPSSSVYATEGVDTTNEKTTAVNRTASEVVSNPEKAFTVSDAKVTYGKVQQILAEQDDLSPKGLVKDDHIQNKEREGTPVGRFLPQDKAYRVD